MTLEELKEIIEKATPGPWVPGSFEDTGFKNQVSIAPSIGAAYGAKDEAESNATLIATSRTALPAAVALIEQMAEAIVESQRILEAETVHGRTLIGSNALAAYEAFKKNVGGE